MTESDATARRLAGVDDQVAACRAWGHTWPSRQLRPGRSLPKGFVPKLVEDGYIEVSEACANGCGKQRRYDLLPGGIYDLAVTRTYTNPKNWEVIHRDEGIGRRHFQGEVIRRVHEDIMTAARSEAAKDAGES